MTIDFIKSAEEYYTSTQTDFNYRYPFRASNVGACPRGVLLADIGAKRGPVDPAIAARQTIALAWEDEIAKVYEFKGWKIKRFGGKDRISIPSPDDMYIIVGTPDLLVYDPNDERKRFLLEAKYYGRSFAKLGKDADTILDKILMQIHVYMEGLQIRFGRILVLSAIPEFNRGRVIKEEGVKDFPVEFDPKTLARVHRYMDFIYDKQVKGEIPRGLNGKSILCCPEFCSYSHWCRRGDFAEKLNKVFPQLTAL